MPDMCFEWTQSVCQFMKNLYKRILDHEHRVSPLSEESYPQQCSVWEYTTRLVSFMFEEGLLDKHEFLSWLLQAIQVDLKPPEDPFNRLFIPLIYSVCVITHSVLSTQMSRLSQRCASDSKISFIRKNTGFRRSLKITFLQKNLNEKPFHLIVKLLLSFDREKNQRGEPVLVGAFCQTHRQPLTWTTKLLQIQGWEDIR